MNDAAPLRCPIARRADAAPDDPALLAESGTTSYADLARAVARRAAGLDAAGVRRGDRVGLLLPNGPDLVALLFALFRVGAVACPISLRLKPPGVTDALARVGADVLVTDAAPPGVDVRVLAPAVLAAEAAAAGRIGTALPPDQPVTAVFTSGSTGRPKAALHTYGNHHHSAVGWAARLPLGPGDRWLLAIPLYHVGGLAVLFRCFTAGAAVVLAPPGSGAGDVLEPLGVTHASMVSTQLVRRLRSERPPPPRLRALLLGGSAIPEAVLDAAFERGLPVHTSYGLTEMASTVTATAPGASRAALRTSGAVLPGRDLRIAADGEILVRGRTLFAGYLEPGGVDPARDPDGWFHTRDLGRLDADGRLHVTGRLDNRFVSGGENVQPEVIEAALLALPGVDAAVVVPVPDAEFGARPVAFVSGAPPEEGTLRDGLRRTLPGFMVPPAYFPLPPGGGLKPDRPALVRLAARLWKEACGG